MDRCALFVDAGYVLADGAMAVHGTRRRESVSWDYPGLLQLLGSMAVERSRLPLLRCYWYEATVEGRRSADHDILADLPGVKLRLAKMRPGRREGVESEIHRDLTTLARNKAVSDAMVVSAEEDLAQVISDVQDMGMRVTLLNIAMEGDWTPSRTLRQECDDIVEISGSHLRPYVELIPGAEPVRAGNGAAPAERRAALQLPPARQDQQAARAAVRGPRDPGPQQSPDAGVRAPVGSYASPAGYAATAEYGPGADYGTVPDFTPAAYEPGAAAAEQGPARQEQAGRRRDELPAASDPAIAHDSQQARQDYGTRPGAAQREFATRAEPPSRPDPAPREDLYQAPGDLPSPAEDLSGERPWTQPRQDGDLSGYDPGAIREKFHPDPVDREPLAADPDRYQPVPLPVPAGSAQIRRFPARGSGQPVPAAGQPPLSPQPPTGQQPSVQSPGPMPGPPALSAPVPGMPAPGPMPGTGADPAGGQSPGGQPIAPVVPMDPSMAGYAAGRGGAYSAPPLSIAGPSGPGADGLVSLAGQQSPPGTSGSLGPSGAPGSSGAQAGPGQPGMTGQRDGEAAQAGRPSSGPQPTLSPVTPVDAMAQQNAGGPAGQLGPAGPAAYSGYSGGQAAGSLADAVQSAHEEGQQFGDSVARDAPALWLEAVLARKPRMPSDLEARLLQGSALPIDFLLHDEVRHALRRGFWDALERARR